ncbi:MAG: hypothetical protein PHS41_10335 [Victivallaceae bacterium]|nr:hypothetical protein [Victivallaceae bacterium]
MSKNFFRFVGIAVSAITLTGCTNFATFDYAEAPGPMVKFQEKGVAQKSVAVMPFLDQRGTKYFDRAQARQAAAHPVGDHGSFYLGLIPLFPFGYVEKEEPENSEDFVSLGRFHFNAAEDLSNAAERSLKNSNLFSRVLRANTLGQAQADYLWRGKVTNTYYNGKMLTYCITYFFSPVLWVLGAPNGVSENELWVDFELVERTSGKVVWQYHYRGQDSIVHWIYARVGEDTSLYAKLMKEAMNGALYDLNQKLPNLTK